MKSRKSRSNHRSNHSAGKAKKALPVQKLTAQITELGRHADGIGSIVPSDVEQSDQRSENARCFVPFALPGETVKIALQGNVTTLLDIETSSEHRINAFCPHFTKCGGCVIQHLDDQAYNKWKRNIVVTALKNREIDVRVDDLIEAHGAGRRRLSLHVRSSKGGWKAGFMIAGSHQIIDLDHCPIVVQDLQSAADLARTLAGAFKDTGKDMDMRFTETEEGLDCDITGAKADGYEMLADISDIAEAHNMARVSIEGDTIVERRRPYLNMGLAKVTPPPGSFLQATSMGEEVLSKLVNEFVGEDAKHVADLFCGVGSFALRLAQRVPVYAADSFEPSVLALDAASRHSKGLKPVRTETRNLFKNPLADVELAPFDVVVFNPPRVGAQAQAHELAFSKAERIVAVSCDPASFARDADILTDGGFVLEKVVPVDQFKWSSHVEVVALFTRPNTF